MNADGTALVESRGLPASNDLSDEALSDELRRAVRESRRWEARRVELIQTAEDRGLPRREGFSSTTAWLMAVSGEPAPVCRSQVAVAEALQVMPQTCQAFAAGSLCASRVKALVRAQTLAPDKFAEDEAALVARVAATSASRVPDVLAVWKHEIDPQAAEAAVERLHGLRAVHVSSGWDDMVHLSGDLDPDSGLVVLAALRSLSEGPALDPADTRTPAQCRADALVEICRRHLDGTPHSRTDRPHLTVTIPWETLQSGHGLVDTEAGPITAETARNLACDATVSRVVLGPAGRPIEVGRARRVIAPALRKALELRDQQCSHPGCQIPARWCDGHHIIPWAEGGRTDLSNLRLLCRRHHRQAHHYQPYPIRE